MYPWLVGYVWADEPRSAAPVVVTGTNPAAEEKIAKDLAQQYWDARREFNFGDESCSLDDIVHLPRNKYRPPTFPFVDDLTFTPSVYISTRSRK